MRSYQLVKIVKAAVGSLLQQKLRSFLSVLGVVCGVTAVIAMIAIGEGAKRETLHQIEQLGIRNIYVRAVIQTHGQTLKARRELSRGLTWADAAQLESSYDGIRSVAGLREIAVALLGVNSQITPQIAACSENYAELLQLGTFSGRFITSQDQRYRNLVCVLGFDVARRLGDLGKVGGYLRMDDHLVKVVGILHRMETGGGKQTAISVRNHNEMILVPLETARTLEGDTEERASAFNGAPSLSEIIVQVFRSAEVMTAAKLIRRTLTVAHHHAQDYQLVVPLELLNQSRRTQRTLNLVLGTIAAISLLVGGIGIMNIMLATVSERTREIGIRRAVGATRQDILVQFLAEAVILTGAGGVIGLACGLGLVVFVAALAGWQMALSWWGVMLPLALSFLVGIFFGLYPAKQAAGVDPMVALRHE